MCMCGHACICALQFSCDCTWLLGIGDNHLQTPPQKDNCRPTNFITTALNCTVLEPSNYSSLRCGHVEKGHKSTEVEAPGLELWENWKQMICPFPFSFHLSPSLFPAPYISVSLISKDNVRDLQETEATLITKLPPPLLASAQIWTFYSLSLATKRSQFVETAEWSKVPTARGCNLFTFNWWL